MNPRFILTILALGTSTAATDAALLHMEFAGGGHEITLAPSSSARIDIVWTMQPNDSSKTKMTGVDLRFNANSVPNPDDPVQAGALEVSGAGTSVPGWSMEATSGVGHPFTTDFFSSAGDVDGFSGPRGSGSEFETVIGWFYLHSASPTPSDTYVSFYHPSSDSPFPSAYDGALAWNLRWQTGITGLHQFRMVSGNPGDGGPQWDPVHGYETFQPLIIHNVPEPRASCLLVLGAMMTTRRRR